MNLVYAILNLPLSVWILKVRFDSVPKEFREAAVMDGSGPFGTLWYVFRPLAGPSLASVAPLAFLFSRNEFLLALSLTSSPAAQTVPVGVVGFVQEYRVPFGPMAAAAVCACVPAIALAVLAQKRLVSCRTHPRGREGVVGDRGPARRSPYQVSTGHALPLGSRGGQCGHPRADWSSIPPMPI